MKNPRIIFMGTPEFAVPVLEALAKRYGKITEGVVAVVTTPDRKKGRGQKLSFSAVKEKALSLGFEAGKNILQPEKMKNEGFVQELAAFKADIFCVVAFRILPESIFTLPTIASFNIHGSLLPKYRGAAPINRAIMAGDTRTGLTTFILQKQVDTGNVLLQEEIEIMPNMTAGELHDTMMPIAADIALRTVDLLNNGNYTPMPQDNSEASPAPKIFREDCRINFKLAALQVHNHIRGLSPYPAAWTEFEGKNMKILKAELDRTGIKLNPGAFIINDEKFIVGCADDNISLLRIQPEGKKAVNVEDFIRGYRGKNQGNIN